MARDRQYVGIDLHRRRSVIVRQTAAGEVLEQVRIDNDPLALAAEIAKAGPDPEVVLEATYGWYWAADVLAECGATVHLAHPLGVKGWSATGGSRTTPRTPRAWPTCCAWAGCPRRGSRRRRLRELRELVRHRAKLVAIRSGLKAQVHAVLAKQGVQVAMTRPVRQGRHAAARRRPAGPAPTGCGCSRCCDLIDAFDYEVVVLHRQPSPTSCAATTATGSIQRLHGVGPVFASVFVAELGDVQRFRDAAAVCSWAGLTPRHRESDTAVHRGAITKQGSKLVRWAAVEAVQKLPAAVQAGRRPRPHRRPARRATSPRSPSPAGCSPSSTTVCATATCAACSSPGRPPREFGQQPRRELVSCHDPRRGRRGRAV